MIPDGIWYGVYGGLIVIGVIVAIIAARSDDPVRIPVLTLASIALSVGLLASLGAGMEYIYYPS